MSHNIFVQNLSGHDQSFGVQNWDKKYNIAVGEYQTATISAPDGSSRAIIVLFNGHEAEQAEITKMAMEVHYRLKLRKKVSPNIPSGNDFFPTSAVTSNLQSPQPPLNSQHSSFPQKHSSTPIPAPLTLQMPHPAHHATS